MKIEEVYALERAVRHRSSRPAEETEQQQPADQRHEREAKVVRVHVLEEQEATHRRGGRHQDAEGQPEAPGQIRTTSIPSVQVRTRLNT